MGDYIKSFRTAWETVLRLAAITDPKKDLDGDLHWHDLRPECGSPFPDDGMDARHIQMLMGDLVAQICPRWNPLTSWMRQIEDFQRAA